MLEFILYNWLSDDLDRNIVHTGNRPMIEHEGSILLNWRTL